MITSPEIKLYKKLKITDSKNIKEIEFPLPKEIESIAVRKFTLSDGSLKVFSEIGTKPYLMVQSDIKNGRTKYSHPEKRKCWQT